jgi:hypothetical protein
VDDVAASEPASGLAAGTDPRVPTRNLLNVLANIEH